MNVYRSIAALVIGCAVCSPAQSALIEIAFSLTGGGIGEGSAVDGVVVFDTDKSPDFVFANSAVFLPESGKLYSGSSKSGGATPFSDDAGLVFEPTVMTYGDLTYYANSDRFTITLSNAGADVFFTVDTPSNGFSLSMDSLPDAPGDYEFAGSAGDFVSGFISVAASGSFSEASWSPTAGYSGQVWYNVRVIEPEVTACSIADLNKDGAIDFLDISAFLTSFQNGCP